MNEVIPYTHLTVSQVIHTKKCKFYGIIVTPDGTNAGYVDIYDGENAVEPLFMRVRCLGTVSVSVILQAPALLQRGLYISLACTGVLVTVFSEAVE